MQGMVGFEVFKRFVTRIDYGRHVITLMDPKSFDPADAGTPVKFVFNGELPQVAGTFEGIPAKFDIDTGARDEITLTSPFVQANDLRAKHPVGVEAVDGWGVGGPARGYVTRGKGLTLGAVEVPDVVAGMSLQTQRRVLLGGLFRQRRRRHPQALRRDLRLRPPGHVPEAAAAAGGRRRRLRPRRHVDQRRAGRLPGDGRDRDRRRARRRPAGGDVITAVDGRARDRHRQSTTCARACATRRRARWSRWRCGAARTRARCAWRCATRSERRRPAAPRHAGSGGATVATDPTRTMPMKHRTLALLLFLLGTPSAFGAEGPQALAERFIALLRYDDLFDQYHAQCLSTRSAASPGGIGRAKSRLLRRAETRGRQMAVRRHRGTGRTTSRSALIRASRSSCRSCRPPTPGR